MPTCGGDFQCTFRLKLPHNMGKIREIYPYKFSFSFVLYGDYLFFSYKMSEKRIEILYRIHAYSLNHGTLHGVSNRDKNSLYSLFFCFHHHRQNAVYTPYLSTQGKLTHKCTVVNGSFYCSGNFKKRHKYRQVVKRTFLSYISRGKVYCYSCCRKFKTTVFGGGTNTVAALLYRSIRQANNIESRNSVGNICFNLDHKTVHSEKSHTVAGIHHNYHSTN